MSAWLKIICAVIVIAFDAYVIWPAATLETPSIAEIKSGETMSVSIKTWHWSTEYSRYTFSSNGTVSGKHKSLKLTPDEVKILDEELEMLFGETTFAHISCSLNSRWVVKQRRYLRVWKKARLRHNYCGGERKLSLSELDWFINYSHGRMLGQEIPCWRSGAQYECEYYLEELEIIEDEITEDATIE